MKLLPRTSPILAIIGPSGAGKSTIVERLVEKGILEITPTWTDRPPRGSEKELEHVFVAPGELDQKVNEGYFAHDPIRLFNLPHRYASPKIAAPKSNKVPCVMVRAAVMPLVDKLYPNRIVYQIEAPKDVVKSRLQSRNEQELGRRFTDYQQEINRGREYAKRTFINNGNLETIVDEIIAALKIEFTSINKHKL
jgi:guanylate kinase